MRYISTRGGCQPLPFQDAVITGLAPDGGLLLPASVPDLRQVLPTLRGAAFTEVALAVISRFVDDIPAADLERIVRESFASFDHPDVVPLQQLPDFRVLELFHGPTLAFKDVALQLLGRLFGYILQQRGEVLNILGATSGDTGSAAIAGVLGQHNVAVFIMYPKGRTSPLQELQMATVQDRNVHPIAVLGSFDDCQAIMKETFGEGDFKAEYSLGAVNSVNWARVLAQITYYVWAWLQCTERDDEQVVFSVPTGNFGDIFAGWLAARIGVPIERLILATNENDILSTFFRSGVYRKGEVKYTITPSMDIQVASNFERFLYYRLGEDPARVRDFMSTFARDGIVQLPDAELVSDPVDPLIRACAIGRDETLETIRRVHAESQYVLDPHTAVGVAALDRLCPDDVPATRRICLATAHPAKFPDAITEATGAPAVHPSLEVLKDRPSQSVTLPADREAIKDYLRTHALRLG